MGNVVDRELPIDSEQVGEVEFLEHLGDFAKILLGFEVISPVASLANALKANLGGDFKQNKKIWRRGKLLVQAQDLGWIHATSALIGHCREVVAVDNDDLSSCQRWLDE